MKLRAEWFWTDRWANSTGALLPLEARGLYREMLTQAWTRGARLPNDPETIQRAVRCSQDEWARCWPLVERFWRVEGTYLVNETQQEIYADAVEAAQRNSIENQAARGKKRAVRAQRSGDGRFGPAAGPAGGPATSSPPSLSQTPSPSPEPTPKNGNGAPDHPPLESDYVHEVWRMFTGARGTPHAQMSPVEWSQIRTWWHARVPLRTITAAVEAAKAKLPEAKSLLYLRPVVAEQEARRQKALSL